LVRTGVRTFFTFPDGIVIFEGQLTTLTKDLHIVAGAGLAASKQDRARSRASPLLQVDAVPKGIVSDVFDDSGTKWIGDDVTRHRTDLLVLAQRMVVITFLPQWACIAHPPINCAGTARLDAAHYGIERFSIGNQQPMQVVGHDHPSQRFGIVVGYRVPY